MKKYKDQLRSEFKKKRIAFTVASKLMMEICILDDDWEDKYRQYNLAAIDYQTAKDRLENVNKKQYANPYTTPNKY